MLANPLDVFLEDRVFHMSHNFVLSLPVLIYSQQHIIIMLWLLAPAVSVDALKSVRMVEVQHIFIKHLLHETIPDIINGEVKNLPQGIIGRIPAAH